MRCGERLRGAACCLAAAVATIGAEAARAGEPLALPAQCPRGGLVDNTFRDAGLRALQALVIRAPGLPADGAIQAHHSAGHIDPQGQAWHYVSAYQVNLALAGALAVAPGLAPEAAGWLRWQAAHTTYTHLAPAATGVGSGAGAGTGTGTGNVGTGTGTGNNTGAVAATAAAVPMLPAPARQGVVFDHWIRASDHLESTCPPGLAPASCPRVDAYDSTAASLLLLADAYAAAEAGAIAAADGAQDAQGIPGVQGVQALQGTARPGTRAETHRAVLHAPALRAALEAAAGTMAVLTQRQGLSWAKPDHQVAYLMDAVEVSAGWRAWARLQAGTYAMPTQAAASLAAARRLDAAMVRHLWHAPSQTWRASLDAPPATFGRWYPDTVAQSWPLLWSDGADPAARGRAHAAWRRAAHAWHGVAGWPERNVDPAGFWWPAIAVAARCVGDEPAARAWVARARRAWLRDDAPFEWPFQVGDLRWLFWLSDPVAP